MNFPSEEIIYRMAQGDESAFGQLRVYFRVPAMKFCLALLKDEVESEIVMLETFEKIWENRANINSGKLFQEYLFAQLRNQVLDRFKKMDKNKSLMEIYLNRMINPPVTDKNIALIA